MTGDQQVVFWRRALRVARTEIAAVTALLIIALGVMTFVEVADDVTEADGQRFDLEVLHWLQPQPGEPRGPWWLHEAMADLTSLGGISVLTLFAVIAFSFLLIQRKRLSAALLVVGLIGGVMLSEGLKALFERERPPAAYQAVETINASFPSGHALLSTVFYLTLGVMLTRAFPKKRLKAFVLGSAILIAILIGLSRVDLGAHWAGWCAGAAWAMALWLVAYAIERRQVVHHAPLQDEDPG
jgi:undecaprenyl-diphosphatase